jgi:uncharacterized protein
MQRSLISQVQLGNLYAKEWPMRKELAPMFSENRIIKATYFSLKVMPILAILTLLLQTNIIGISYLPQSIAMALLLLSLPFQGLLWLGKRADTKLTPALNAWYQELYQKMSENGCECASYSSKPNYRQLGLLLKDMFSKMDKTFTKEQF